MPERKPPRMRAACGQCHSAKVKCSGEKTGCTRCAKLGLKCEFGISMVGRASKKKQPSDNQSDALMTDGNDSFENGMPDFDSNSEAVLNNSGGEFNFNLAPHELIAITGLEDFSFDGIGDINSNHDHSTRHTAAPSSRIPGIASVPDLSASISSQGGSPTTENSRQHLYQTNSAESGTDTAPQATFDRLSLGGDAFTATTGATFGFPDEPLTLSSDGAARVSATESMEPLFCFARMAFYLEQHLNRVESIPIDKTLLVIRNTLRQIMDMAEWEGTMGSLGCRSLIFACLAMVVRLYSKINAGLQAGNSHRAGNGSSESTSANAATPFSSDIPITGPSATAAATPSTAATTNMDQPGLRIGSFEIDDPEDQLRIQSQVIASELGRCVRLIKTMACDQAKRCEKGQACGSVRGYQMLEETATELKTTLERRSCHDKRMVHPLI